MIWAIPEAPDDSSFILDFNQDGQSRISWNLPNSSGRDVYKVIFGLILF